MPNRPGFTITVNSVECTAEDVLGEKTVFSETIPGIGQVTGFYVTPLLELEFFFIGLFPSFLRFFIRFFLLKSLFDPYFF